MAPSNSFRVLLSISVVDLFDKMFKINDEINCVITEKSGNLVSELTNKILKTAAVYEKQKKDKNFKPYIVNDPKD